MTSSLSPVSASEPQPAPKVTGAALIAKSLHQLGVKVIFGLVGIPVVQIAEEAIALGIRFIAFRNEQAASYAATAYGYLTGKPGVCLVVGGPGVLHAIAGVGNSSANAFPMLLIAGSSETHLVSRGAFQEMDAISLLTPHTKFAIRAGAETIPHALSEAFRTAGYGRPGTSFVDLPADVIQGLTTDSRPLKPLPAAPRAGSDPERILEAADLLRNAKSPLVVLGKGAAFSRADVKIRKLIEQTQIPFLPTPMGKGVLPDSHPSNTSSARSAALKNADVVLVLGARLNWILHFGSSSKWNADVKFIQVDISAEEIGKNAGAAELGIVGDINVVVSQLSTALQGWSYDHSSSAYMKTIQASKLKNEANAARVAKIEKSPMSYHQTFDIIKRTIHRLSPPEDSNVVYVSEGANTMDISRSVFSVEEPRMRMDAGSNSTMGAGLGYAIAAHSAYNMPNPEGLSKSASRKKIVCLEGDSAFGFSMPEVETMARYNMDILMFVINNGGIYHGDCEDSDEWLKLQEHSVNGVVGEKGLRSTSLGYQVGYEKMAEMCGGKGFLVKTPQELEKATEEGFKAGIPVVVNIIIESGAANKLVSLQILL